MNRYNRQGKEREGYEAYKNRRSDEGYPYHAEYSYRQGWEAAKRDERWDRYRQRAEEEEADERAADKEAIEVDQIDWEVQSVEPED